MSTMQQNHFQPVIAQLQGTPQNQRPKKLIEAIAEVMQQSGNAQVQEWGQSLENIETQLLQAFNTQS